MLKFWKQKPTVSVVYIYFWSRCYEDLLLKCILVNRIKVLLSRSLHSHESGQLIKRQMCPVSEGENVWRRYRAKGGSRNVQGKGRCSSIYVVRKGFLIRWHLRRRRKRGTVEQQSRKKEQQVQRSWGRNKFTRFGNKAAGWDEQMRRRDVMTGRVINIYTIKTWDGVGTNLKRQVYIQKIFFYF